MSHRPLKLIIFLGSTRIGRNGLRVAKFMNKTLTDKGYEVELFDPIELKLPLLEQPMHFYQDPKQVPPVLPKLNEKIAGADAFIVVSGEYNNMIPPALTNTMNHFPPSSYAYKPSLIVTYSVGRVGGVMASAALRSFLPIIGCPPVPMVFSIPEVTKAIDEAGNALTEYPTKRVQQALEQFDWFVGAMADKRKKDGTPAYNI